MFGVSRGLNQKIFAAFHRPLASFLNMANPSTRVSAYSSGSPTSAPLKRVGTHNGSFHCDEALGCFMIRLTHNFSSAEIVRTRDPQVSRSYYICWNVHAAKFLPLAVYKTYIRFSLILDGLGWPVVSEVVRSVVKRASVRPLWSRGVEMSHFDT